MIEAADAIARRSLGRTLLALGGIQTLVVLFTVVRSKVVALAFGPAGVGAVSLIDQVVSLAVQLVSLSLPFAAVKFLSLAHSQGREPFRRLYAAFFWALAALSALGAVLLLITLWWRPRLLGADLLAYRGAALWAALAMPGTVLTDFLITAMASAQRTQASGMFGLWRAVALALFSTAGVMLAGLPGYYAGAVIALTMLWAAGGRYLARLESASAGRPQTGWTVLRQSRGVAPFALALSAAAFAQPAAMLVARYAALETTGLAGAGLLQAAMALGLAVFVVMRQPNALMLVPRVNRDETPAWKFREAAEYLRLYAPIVSTLALPFVIVPELWLYAVYSREFLAAAQFTYLFVAAQVLKLFAGVSVALLIGLDEIAAQLVITLIGLAALAGLSWLLAPELGIPGIGLAALADAFLNLTLSVWWLRRRFGFPAARLLARPLVLVALLTAAGAAGSAYGGLSGPLLLTKGAACLLAIGAGALLARRHGLIDWSSLIRSRRI